MRSKQVICMALLAINMIPLFTGCSGLGVTANAQNGGASKVFNSAEGIVSQGTIEAKEVSINSKLPGRILKVYVEEGQEVKAGEVLVEIESDDIEAKKEQAEALLRQAQAGYDAAQKQEAAAKSQLEKAENGAREQEIAQAQAAYDLYMRTYDRVKNLYDKGAVSAQKVDEVQTQLKVAEQQLSIAKEGARNEDKSAAAALYQQAQAGVSAAQEKVEQAEAGIREVESYLKDTKITAPIDGVVTALNSHEGELVSTGMSIGTVTDIENAWVEVNVKETDLEKILIGGKADVKVPSFSQKLFSGEVVRINKKPDFATKRSTNDNGDFDILSFGIKIELDNQDKTLRPGMTAFVQFKK